MRSLRSQNTRQRLKRPEGWKPPNAMETDNIDLGPDVVCRWVRTHLNSEKEDVGALPRRMSRGWELVKLAEVPHLKKLEDSQGRIVQNGCVLCKNLRSTVQLDVEYYEDQALGAVEAERSKFTIDDGETAMKKFAEPVQRKVFKGSKPA